MRGMNIIEKIEQVGTADGKPSGFVKIVDCGETSASSVHDEVEKQKVKDKLIAGTVAYSLSVLTSLRSKLCM